MKQTLSILAVAAMIVGFAYVAMNGFVHPAQQPAMAFDEVAAAFLARPWVHLGFNDGNQQWISIQNGRFYYKNADGSLAFEDHRKNLRHAYRAAADHIDSNTLGYSPLVPIPAWRPAIALEAVTSPVDNRTHNGSYSAWQPTGFDSIDGRQLVRFERFCTDELGRSRMVEQLWADSQSKLPVKAFKRYALPTSDGIQSVTLVIEFPDTGPTDIYDLGVSRDIPIAKQ